MDKIIEKFFSAETMVECYHKDVVFEDLAFGVLNGNKASDIWNMLC